MSGGDAISGFGGSVGLGARPALLVVDMMVACTDPDLPLGFEQGAAIGAIDRLLTAVRERSLPAVFMVAGVAAPAPLLAKVPALAGLAEPGPATEVDPRLRPGPGEPVIRKAAPSAFHGTSLSAHLLAAGVDGAIVTGNSTSGCVRATVVDAVSSGFRVTVPCEAVSDRDAEAHSAALRDIERKYGDVVALDQVLLALSGGGG